MTEVALRVRHQLSVDGIVFVVATVSADKGDSLAAPEVVLRGVPIVEEEPLLSEAIGEAVEDSLDRAADDAIHDPELIEKVLHDDLAEFLYRRIRRRPMIVPVVVEI
jgi:ribonuclease J